MIKEIFHGEIASILKDLNKKPLPGRLTATEAAEFLGISKSTLYGYTCNRKIPYYKFGRTLFFYTKELDDCIRNSSLCNKSRQKIANDASEILSSAARKRVRRDY
jgi:excisionase family DNA binding protein